jgi:hypothetical protein
VSCSETSDPLQYVDPAHVAIIESAQPYMPNTGLPRLNLLQRFSNNDKHRLIHAAVTNITGPPQITVQWAIPTTILSVDYRPGEPVRDDDENRPLQAKRVHKRANTARRDRGTDRGRTPRHSRTPRNDGLR